MKEIIISYRDPVRPNDEKLLVDDFGMINNCLMLHIKCGENKCQRYIPLDTIKDFKIK